MDKTLKAAVRKKKRPAPSMPAINIGAPMANITMDLKELAAEVGALSKVMVQLAKQQEAILQAIQVQNQSIGVLAQRKVAVDIPEIKVPAVNIPARPSNFEVEFVKDGTDTVGMRIRGSKTH